MTEHLADRVALVTGSTSGIGLAIASTLAAAGASVVVHGRTETRLATAMQEVGTPYGVAADISTPDGCATLVREIDRLARRPDILVNNAGVFRDTSPHAAVPEYEAALAVNTWSGLRLAQAFLPAMLHRNEHGRIIWMSSLAAKVPEPTLIPYAISKAAQLYLTGLFARMASGTTVTSTAVMPGITQTEGADRLVRERYGADSRAAWSRSMDDHPANLNRRPAKPDEIASLVLYLTLPISAVMQGRAFIVDNGELPTPQC